MRALSGPICHCTELTHVGHLRFVITRSGRRRPVGSRRVKGASREVRRNQRLLMHHVVDYFFHKSPIVRWIRWRRARPTYYPLLEAYNG